MMRGWFQWLCLGCAIAMVWTWLALDRYQQLKEGYPGIFDKIQACRVTESSIRGNIFVEPEWTIVTTTVAALIVFLLRRKTDPKISSTHAWVLVAVWGLVGWWLLFAFDALFG
ncbi:MAG: hypothetical protein PHF70_11890 [Opitutales bacterium]|nr:hypothetical protein [Opitutales bacterium]